MSNKTINEALKDLFLAHGGDASELADNKSLSDFIADVSTVLGSNATGTITPVVESGTKIADYDLNGVEGSLYAPIPDNVIDDAETSETTTYSSSKIESLIPSDELPDVSEVANGAILAVVNGAWTLCTISVDITTGDITFTPVE